MKFVVALYESQARANSALARLKSAGFSDKDAKILRGPEALAAAANCSTRGKVLEDTVFLTTLSVVVFSIFGVLAGAGSVHYGATLGWAIGTVFVFAVLGALFGTFIGSILSASNAEQDAVLFQEGVEEGGIVVMVETADDRVEQATNAVQREHPTTVQVCTRKASSAPKHSGAAGSGAGMAA